MRKNVFISLVLGVLTLVCVGCGGSKSSETVVSQDSVECVETDKFQVEKREVLFIGKDTLRIDSVVYDLVRDNMYKTKFHYCVPQVWSTDTAIAGNINREILSELMIDGPRVDDTWWLQGAGFTFDTDSTVLNINLEWAWFASKGAVYHYSSLFFNMEDGKRIDCRKIPFSALFTVKGYLDFLQSKKWFTKFHDAVEKVYSDYFKQYPDELVGELEEKIEYGYNSQVWNIDYEIKKDKIEFCRYIGAVFSYGALLDIEPTLLYECKLSELDPYLSDVGRVILNLESDSLSFIQRKMREKELWEQVDDYAFAEIDGIRFGINMSDSTNMTGYVFSRAGVEQIRGIIAEDHFEMTGMKSGEHFRFPKEKAITKMSEWNMSKNELTEEWQ